jgi:hypothetical protein
VPSVSWKRWSRSRKRGCFHPSHPQRHPYHHETVTVTCCYRHSVTLRGHHRTLAKKSQIIQLFVEQTYLKNWYENLSNHLFFLFSVFFCHREEEVENTDQILVNQITKVTNHELLSTKMSKYFLFLFKKS